MVRSFIHSEIRAMAHTKQVELRTGEQWADVARAFMTWCVREKKILNAGVHQGDLSNPVDGQRYAAISVPDHNPALLTLLQEWAAEEGRAIR